MHPKVDLFLQKASKWQEEMTLLRRIILDCGLVEDFKWNHPCYTFNRKNIVLIHGFKDYCALLFHKGALLKDNENILVQQTENVQAARQIRFQNATEVKKLENTVKSYVHEAVEVEKAGLTVSMKKTAEYDTPVELTKKFQEVPGLQAAFESLTPGRQRGYLLHFSKAKQTQTRESRIEKNIARIFDGKGLNDR